MVIALQKSIFILSQFGLNAEEDTDLDDTKLRAVEDGVILYNVTGIRLEASSRLDGVGYDITRRKCTAFISRL